MEEKKGKRWKEKEEREIIRGRSNEKCMKTRERKREREEEKGEEKISTR